MRCAYLAHDRVDISEAIKCLARAMSKPKAGHMTQVKRVARYLKGVPRKALQYPAVWSDCAARTTFAPTQLNSTKRL